MTPPTQNDVDRGAVRVEFYRCTDSGCGSYERFPRFINVWTLMETRRGRNGEWSNCFAMLCRALAYTLGLKRGRPCMGRDLFRDPRTLDSCRFSRTSI